MTVEPPPPPQVDGTPLQGYSNHEAVELLKNTGQIVRLKLARYVSGPKYDQLKQAIARTEMATPGGPAAAAAAAGAGPPEPPARPSLHGRQVGSRRHGTFTSGRGSSNWSLGVLYWLESGGVVYGWICDGGTAE